MQPSSYYKISRIPEVRADSFAQTSAMAWLASRLRWERTLDRLRAETVSHDSGRQAA